MTAIKASLVTLFMTGALVSAGCGDDSTPTTPTTTRRSSPVTERFASNLVVQGSAARIVSAIATGTLTATLTTVDQPSAVVGFAIGLRNANGTGCLVTKDVIVAAGSAPELSAQVDAGDYCVKISDRGPLTTPMTFTITITYP
jgi:hypothetical protein